MKKLIKGLIVLLIIAFTFNVKAVVIEPGKEFSKISGSSYNSFGLHYVTSDGNAADAYIINYRYGASGKTFVAYCIDPDKEPSSYGYSVTRILGDTTSDKVLKHDAGITAILANGCTQENGCSDNESYAATSIALRAYTLGLYGFIRDFDAYNGDISGGTYSCAIANQAAEWASKNTSIANSVTGKNCSNGDKTCFQQSVCRNNSYWKNARLDATSDTSRNILASAEQLFNLGLEASASEKNEKTDGEFSVKFGIASTKSSNNDDSKTTTVPIIVQAKGIEKGKLKINKFSINCPTCKENGVTYKLTFTDKNNTQIVVTPLTELSEYLPINDNYYNGSISLNLTFVKDSSVECDGSIEYKVNYSTTAKTSTTGAVAAVLDTNDGKNQRFFVYEKLEAKTDSTEKTGSLTNSLPCDDKKVCKTEIKEPECYGDENGYIKAPDDIKSCIIDNNDEAGNKYKSTQLSTNKYCSIYCKEDYATIQLQKVIGGQTNLDGDATCGGSFTLENNRIKGTKSCYAVATTTKGASGNEKYKIDVDAFEDDMDNIADRFLEEYRKYMEAVEGLKHVEYDECTGSTCYGDCSASGTKSVYYSYSYYGRSGKNLVSKTGYNAIGGPPSCGYPTECCEACPDPDVEGSYVKCNCECCGGGCSNGKSVATLNAELNTQKENANNAMKRLLNEYNQTIANYNKCTTGWKNTDDFLNNVTLKFKYNEHIGDEEFYSPYYDLLIDNDIDAKLEATNAKTSYTIDVWKKTVDSKFSTSPFFTSTTADNVSPDSWGYSKSYGSVFEDEGFIKCSASGCVVEKKKVSKAAFIRKSLTSEREYITPTLFSQNGMFGKISVIGSGYNEIENTISTPIFRALPISNKACVGGEFNIYIESLGQFYDIQGLKTGRLINYVSSSSEANKAVATYQKNNGIDTFDGDYECSYNTDCDCDTEITQCDSAYAGDYYYLDDVCDCLIGSVSRIRIKCCKIKYKSEAVVENHPDEYLNKYYCPKTDEYYQTKKEAENACTSDYVNKKTIYLCNGKVQNSTECRESVTNTYTYNVACNYYGYGSRNYYYYTPMPGMWSTTDVYGQTCPLGNVYACDAVSYYGGIYARTISDVQRICSLYTAFCLRRGYSRTYQYGEKELISQTNNTCPAGYYYDANEKTVGESNCYEFQGSCSDSSTCTEKYTGVCKKAAEQQLVCPEGFVSYDATRCIKKYEVQEIKSTATPKSVDKNRVVIGECYDYYGNKYDYSKLTKTVPNCDDYCDTSFAGKYYDSECHEIEITCCTNTGNNDVCKTAKGECYKKESISKERHCDETEEKCPNCKLVCNPKCEVIPRCNEPGCCPACKFKCFNCIFDNGVFNLTTKPISSTGLKNSMSNREYGYNWITSSKIKDLNLPSEISNKMSLFSEKAEATVNEIVSQGETIYGGEKPSDSSALEFSIIMDQDVIKYLKEYNNRADKSGGYANESLKCYDDYASDGTVKYKKVYCYSEVIDGLLANGARITIGSGERLAEDKRQNYSRNSGYWELWEQSQYYKGTSAKALGGPSWK